jgi:mannitol/fructose-specific phosphotransferase system IIA component (Ntr-type)
MKAESLSEAYLELITALKRDKLPKDIDDIIAELMDADESAFNISPGIFIPHLRMKSEKDIQLSIGLSLKGIKGRAVKKKLHLFFLELAPAKETDNHIYFLAETARLIERVSIKNLLNDVATANQLYNKLMELYHSPGEK